MPNNINELSPNFRDFLLNRNIVADTVSNNGLESLLNGIGLPTTISNYNQNVQAGVDILVDGVHYKDLNVINNKFQVDEEQHTLAEIYNLPGTQEPSNVLTDGSDYQNLNLRRNIFRADEQYYSDASIILNSTYQPSTQQDSYLDENGHLNVGGPSTEAYDIVGSLLNGGGIGFDPNGGGAVPNYDVRTTLAGRVLTGAGVINDTKMGQLNSQYLISALANNATFNVQEETIGNLNLNPLSIIMGNDIIKANYTITVARTTFGKIFDIFEKILGFERPISIIDNAASIFGHENNWVSSLESSQSLIKNTGKGQVLRLFYNLGANSDKNFIGDKRFGYAPMYEDDRTQRGINQGVYSGGTYPKIAKDFNEDGNLYNVDYSDDGQIDFIWTDNRFNNPLSTTVPGTEQDPKPQTMLGAHSFKQPKGLLYKTKELFKEGKIRTLTSGHFLTEDDSNVRISKGSAVRGEDNTFCRTWTPYDRYGKVEDLQKHEGLDGVSRQKDGKYEGFSVLDDNGFVKIGSYGDDDVKRYMFSIENLAWIGQTDKLLESEKGDGDRLTGHKGRIMWFPPYDMSFNETTSVNWDKNNFIGRGEPVYTYNNTERTGNLSWKIVIDHPNYMNFMKGKSDGEIASFFAGCKDIDEIWKGITTQEERDKEEIKKHRPITEVVDDEKIGSTNFNLYFANDSSVVNTLYEDGLIDHDENFEIDDGSDGRGYGLLTTYGDNGTPYVDNTNFGLNSNFTTDFLTNLQTSFKEKCKYCKINIKGYASEQGNVDNNLILSKNRSESIKTWFLANILESDDEFRDRRIKIDTVGAGETGSGCSESDSRDKKECKEARYVAINIEYSPELKDEAKPTIPKVSTNSNAVDSTSFNYSKFYNEGHYFKKLAQTDPTVFNSISEKIAFFQPAFHAITPEGFNSRLTFLQQCTRQGPTLNETIKNPSNLAFGRPPVCILRIGDFYNTKIIIDNMAFDYEPMVWDLNPEGVGVQPMIVTVNMSFAFIGGSSLNSPINKLQNAVTFNYFANTEIYDPRAEKVSIGHEPTEKEPGDGRLVKGVFPSTENILEDSDKSSGVNNDNPTTVANQEAIAENEAIINVDDIPQ
tara:strand:+ start:35439 stop:38723 length:3285 start_codon:yes stop_codon:yes gene_type:complete